MTAVSPPPDETFVFLGVMSRIKTLRPKWKWSKLSWFFLFPSDNCHVNSGEDSTRIPQLIECPREYHHAFLLSSSMSTMLPPAGLSGNDINKLGDKKTVYQSQDLDFPVKTSEHELYKLYISIFFILWLQPIVWSKFLAKKHIYVPFCFWLFCSCHCIRHTLLPWQLS